MFSATLLVALLSSHGDAPTLEPAPRQAPAQEVRGVANPAFVTPRHELELLRRDKPSLYTGGTVVAMGAALTVIGVGLTVLSLSMRNEGQAFGLMIGGSVFGLGTLVGSIGGLVMAIHGAELTRIDARIRELEAQLAQSVPPHVVLARF